MSSFFRAGILRLALMSRLFLRFSLPISTLVSSTFQNSASVPTQTFHCVSNVCHSVCTSLSPNHYLEPRSNLTSTTPKHSFCPYSELYSAITLNTIPNHKPTLTLTTNSIFRPTEESQTPPLVLTMALRSGRCSGYWHSPTSSFMDSLLLLQS